MGRREGSSMMQWFKEVQCWWFGHRPLWSWSTPVEGRVDVIRVLCSRCGSVFVVSVSDRRD